MELISTQNTTIIYQRYLKLAQAENANVQSVKEDAGAQKADSTQNAEKATSSNQYLPYYNEPPAPPAPFALAYSKWTLIVNTFGLGKNFNDTFEWQGKAWADRGVLYLEKASPNNDSQYLLPGLGVRYKPTRSTALEANFRFVTNSTTSSYFNYDLYYYSAEVDAQAKGTVWHKVDPDNHDRLALNLGLGPASSINLHEEHGAKVQSLPPSLQSKVLLGGKASLELEIAESFSLSLEITRLTNMKGYSIMGGAFYMKYYMPDKTVTPENK